MKSFYGCFLFHLLARMSYNLKKIENKLLNVIQVVEGIKGEPSSKHKQQFSGYIVIVKN